MLSQTVKKHSIYIIDIKICHFIVLFERVDLDDNIKSKKISNDQELIQSDPISCPQNQKGNN